MDKIHAELTERFKTFIALTLEHCNTLFDNYVQQVKAVMPPPPPPAAPQARQVQEVVAEAPIASAARSAAEAVRWNTAVASAFYSPPPPPTAPAARSVVAEAPIASAARSAAEAAAEAAAGSDELYSSISSYSESENDSMVVGDDQVDVPPPLDDEEEEEEEENISSSSVSSPSPPPQKRRTSKRVTKGKKTPLKRIKVASPPAVRRKYNTRRNPKRTVLFRDEDFANNDAAAGDIDLYEKDENYIGGTPDTVDLQLLLARVATRSRNTTLLSVMDNNEWFRRRYLEPLKGVRTGLGHDGPRSSEARQLFDQLINDAPLVKYAVIPTTKGKCALCCINGKNCTTSISIQGTHFVVANRCIHIATALTAFCCRIIELSNQEDDATAKDLFELDKMFERILMAHAGKKDE